jgi:gamma-glutamylcyclotransferase (GGCT)/AIG2-like uncharacterized protein YtfP
MPLLFSYGTLRDRATQVAVFGHEVGGSSDELLGFARRLIEVRDAAFAAANGATQAIVEPTGRDSDRVVGSVLEVSDADLARSDAYEPPGYRRVEARFASGRRGWVYAETAGSESE